MEHLNNSKFYFMASDSTSYYADSVEWCPFQHLANFFVCGTYQLDETTSPNKEKQTRHGNVVLYKLVTSDCESTTSYDIMVEDTILTGGILDMKWCPSMIYNKIILALACSDGKILLKSINGQEGEKRNCLFDVTDLDLSENGEKMLLSIDWAFQNENSASIITSDTKGFLSYLQVREAGLDVLYNWQAHNFESWIAAFNHEDKNVIYSGGDDCCFKAWDVRILPSPVFTKKSHSMGVTAIMKNKLNDNLLVSGSYDENIILWDTRQMKSSLSSICVGGGIWRLKWHPVNPQYLLSATMHNGFHVLSVKDEKLIMELSYNDHKSLAYGVDWCHISMNSSSNKKELLIKNIIASCSFYDSLLHVWGINF